MKHKQVIDEDVLSLPEKEDAFVKQQNQDLTNLGKSADKNLNQKLEEVFENDLKNEKTIALQKSDSEEDIQDLEQQQEQKKKIDEVEQTVSKHGKKKKYWNWIFFAINVVVVVGILLYQILGKGEIASPIGLEIHILPLIAMLGTFAFTNLIEAFGISYLTRRNVGKWRFALSYKVNAIGRYYDAVTPLGTGGQPFQIAYLKSHEVPLHSAMSIPLAKMVFQQLNWNLISLVCLIISFVNPKYNTFVSVASVIGFVLGSALLFAIVFLSVSKNWGKKVIAGFFKLLQKMRILKNYEKQYEKIMKTVEDFQSVMRQYAKSPRDFIVVFVTFFLKQVSRYMLPYCVFALFKGFDGSVFFDFFIMSVLIDLASGFFPLPGGTGMSELTFAAMFQYHFSGGTLFWALLVWRFMTYYYHLLRGLCVLSYDMFYGNRKYKWNQRKDTLKQESMVFKQEQINRFRAERNRQRKMTSKKSAR